MISKVALLLLSVSGETFSAHSLDGIPYHLLNDPIVKKDGDYREYADLVLENKLKVLLISDKHAVHAAVGLQTGTGWRDDPRDFPGLSNLCNKLLVERKSPDDVSFHKYITSNAGYVTAEVSYTESEVSFQVHPFELNRSLERLSELFVNPSFDETTLQEKATAINNALAKMGNRGASYMQAAKAALRTSHKYTNYKLGPLNPSKLTTTFLLDHFNKHYSSNLMTLVVLGSADMDTLKNLVIPRFSKVKNSELKPASLGSPYNDKNQVKHINIQAPEESVRLSIEFGLGPVTDETLKQLHFIKYLLGSWKTNSLVTLLRSKGSLGGLSVDISNLKDFTEVTATINHVSAEYVQEMVYILFMYLETLKAKSVTLESTKPSSARLPMTRLPRMPSGDTNPISL
ncbi:metalloprotease [Entomophthora muscae]|uniref:Metalloprotease n=1 Tax=Entomophthora muscae TaxID=34485 RepID=A0ACC2TYN0_9FUNG|nr:metalloprotease [Entomophthora muscae]